MYFITQTTSRTDALVLTELIVDNMIGRDAYTGHAFDSPYLSRVETDEHTLDRRSKLRVAVPRYSQAGRSLLAEDWEATQSKFYDTFEKLQQDPSSSDERSISTSINTFNAFEQVEQLEGPVITTVDNHNIVAPSVCEISRILDERDYLWIIPLELTD